MGQAKQRGTKEQRIAQALKRNRERPISGLRKRQAGLGLAAISALVAGLTLGSQTKCRR